MNKIKKILLKNKQIIENFSYLSIIQLFNMALPLITYPYLMHILGANLYGRVIFAQVVVSYLSIIVNFGFEASATRDISINKNNKRKLSEIISSIFQIKIILWFISFILLIGFILFIPSFYEYKTLYLLSFGLVFNELLFPIWYFQGVEKMKYITFINVSVRCLFLILIFLFVKTKNDYILVPLCNSIGAFCGGIVAILILIRNEKINLQIQSFHTLKKYMGESLQVFLSNLVISIKDRFSVLFIGNTLGMQDVAIYDLGIKVMTVFMQPIVVANNAIYPSIARNFNLLYIKKFIKISFVIILCIVLAIQPFLSNILDFLSKGLNETLLVTRILLISPILFTISFALSRNVIIAKGYYKYSFKSVLVTTFSYLLMIALIYLFGFEKYVLSFAVITTMTYTIEMAYRIYVCKFKI